MHVTCLTSSQELTQLTPEWDALLERAVQDTIFLRPFWHLAWWHAYGAGKELRLLTARDEGGQLLGIAPLFQHEVLIAADAGAFPAVNIERPREARGDTPCRTLHLLGGTEVSDYLGFVLDRAAADAACAAFYRYIVEELPGWQMVDLHCLTADSPVLRLFPALAAGSGLDCAAQQEDVCPIIDLPADWEVYLASLDKKQRHELRRKVRKAHREARISWHRTDNEAAELDADLDLFFRLHEQSDPEKEAFWDDSARRFFRDIAHGAQRRGWLDLSFVSFNEEPVAALFCFDYNGDILVYNSGYDPAAYPGLTPGLVQFSYVIRDAIARGRKRFDFLRGDERYKYDLGGKETTIHRLTLRRA